MRRLANERALYALLSLVIATVAWLYVATAQNPIVERSMTLDLHVRGLSAAETVVQAPTRVQVSLRGARSALAPLTPALLDASVDLSRLAPGAHDVPVTVVAPPDVRVVERTPPEALVVLDALARQRFPVQVTLVGTPPEGVTVGTPRVTPPEVAVSGPAVTVALVRRAVVTLDTTNLRQQIVGSLPVHLMDAGGQTVHGLVITPPIVETSLAVREGVITKVVPVVPTLAGVPAAGMGVTAVTVTPQTVSLSGPGDLLAGIRSAATAPVDTGGARGDVTRSVVLALPPGVTASVQRVTVGVHVGPALLSRVFAGVPVRVLGAPKGLIPRAAPARVDVQVEGPQDAVQRLSARTLVVQVDVARDPPGSHRVAPTVVLPAGVHLVAVHPADVVVTLTASS